jgi:hypothetical protein
LTLLRMSRRSRGGMRWRRRVEGVARNKVVSFPEVKLADVDRMTRQQHLHAYGDYADRTALITTPPMRISTAPSSDTLRRLSLNLPSPRPPQRPVQRDSHPHDGTK